MWTQITLNLYSFFFSKIKVIYCNDAEKEFVSRVRFPTGFVYTDFVLMPLGKARSFSLQLWVNSRADWFL